MDKEKTSAVMRAQKRKKQKAVDAFGGECQICGYDKCIDALEFHHINKDDKEEKPSYVIMRWSWKRAKKELDKCILVCSNCHKEIHSVDSSLEHTYLLNHKKPWISKECEYCKKTYDTKSDEQKYCSVSCRQFARRKVERPSKDELNTLIESGIAWVQLGRMFGVSDNAVRKWARKYEIIS